MKAKKDVKKVVRLKRGEIVTGKGKEYDFAVVPEYESKSQKLVKLTLYDNNKKCYDPICVTEALLHAYGHDCKRQQTDFTKDKERLEELFIKNVNRAHLTRQMGMEIKKFIYCIYLEAVEKDLFVEVTI